MSTKLTIDEMQKIAKKRGGKCLSVEYKNARTKLKWKCDKKHEWFAIPSSIKRGTWCPECGAKKTGDSKKLNINVMHELARKRDGKCLSTKYKGSDVKLKWQCNKEHSWLARPDGIRQGRWCRKCGSKRRGDLTRMSILQMQELATKFGGKCLSEKYVGARNKLKWQCAEGHKWNATPDNVKRGSWCPKCGSKRAGDARRLNIDIMQNLAKKRGGLCLSTKYVNTTTHLRWQCVEGHEWPAVPSTIIAGSWCPECSLQNVAENICREVFEHIFSKKFPKVKPKWLINNDGNRMEFDGYNKELCLAFEYHGEQHYRYNAFFYRNIKEKFSKRKIDDKTKHILSKEKGVRLVEIPYTIDTLDLYKFIIEQCINLDVQIPKHKKINIDEIKSTYRTKNLFLLEKIAKEQGGKLISKIYLGTNSKHNWMCSAGHQWKATPHNIKVGKWCPQCAANRVGDLTRLGIEEMHELATKKGGRCLSTKYINALTKLKWQCAKKHTWEATPNKIQQGRWCAKCSRRFPLDMKEMQAIAAKKGGRCLSAKYINARTKLKWQCSQGHKWDAVPDSVKRSTWCPICAGNFVKQKI